MSKNQISRRGFLKGIAKTAVAALMANVLRFVPEAQGVLAGQPADAGDVAVEPLSASRVDELVLRAAGEADGQILREFLASRGFDLQPDMVQGFWARGDTFKAQLLITGFDGAPHGASLIFLTGTVQGDAGRRFPVRSWAAWIVDEAVYVIKDGLVVLFPDGTERMQGVPRLPRQTTSGGVTIQSHCCPLYYSCWTLDALCVSLTVCCFLGGAICCPAAIGACLTAIAQCGQAASCGSPEGC